MEVTKIPSRYHELVEKATNIMLDVAMNIDKYPIKSSYNKVLGGWTKSQRDVITQATNAVKVINNISEGMYGKKAVLLQEDEPVNVPGFKLVEEES
tara:strand:+ start:106 stop:393 length:288 start_codon:yes stop_codon:yes gene_type:complete